MPEDQSRQAAPKLFVPPGAEDSEFAGQDRQVGAEDTGSGDETTQPEPNCLATFVVILKLDGNCDILYNPNELVGRVPGSVPAQRADPNMVKNACRDIHEFFDRQAVVEMIAQNFPAIMANAAQQAQQAQLEAMVRAGLQG